MANGGEEFGARSVGEVWMRSLFARADELMISGVCTTWAINTYCSGSYLGDVGSGSDTTSCFERSMQDPDC